jgi:hypothetical protein
MKNGNKREGYLHDGGGYHHEEGGMAPLGAGAPEGFRSIVNKNFPTQRTRKPRSNLGDVINERGR